MKKVEAIIRPERLERVKKALEERGFIAMNAARTGNYGDGKIFVVPVEKAVRVRTGEVEE